MRARRRAGRDCLILIVALQAQAVYGFIRVKWTESGRETGFLGYPVTGELPAFDDGRHSDFQGGMVYGRPSTGALDAHARMLFRTGGYHLVLVWGPDSSGVRCGWNASWSAGDAFPDKLPARLHRPTLPAVSGPRNGAMLSRQRILLSFTSASRWSRR